MGLFGFAVLATVLIVSALGVVLSRNPVRSALSLVVTLFFLAVAFVLLDAHLVAALQVVVYAGAIMILFLFVIMLLNLQTDPPERRSRTWRGTAWAAGGATAAALLAVLSRAGRLPGPPAGTELPAGFGGVEALSRSLFTDFVLPFEVTSILLLVGIVGAVVVARRREDTRALPARRK